MPAQQETPSLAARLGNRVSAANAAFKDKAPIETNARIPPGINNGIAKLSSMYWKEQTEDGKKCPKGQIFFRCSATVLSPDYTEKGEKAKDCITSQIINLCDVPARGEFGKEETFEENWDKFRSLLRHLGVKEPPLDAQNDPTGKAVEQYYLSAMRALTDPQAKPVYITFSTRGFTPKKTAQNPNPTEMVFEDWHGLADPKAVEALSAKFDPAAGVREKTDARATPPPAPTTPTPTARPAPAKPATLKEEVQALVEVAMNDPDGATDDGCAAAIQLEKLAWKAGWSQDSTKQAANWAQIGEMALSKPKHTAPIVPAPGQRFLFAKRTKEGAKLTDSSGKEFPPQEVVVATVNIEAKTCTLKTVKDNRDVVDIRTKEPINAKFEWLEHGAPY